MIHFNFSVFLQLTIPTRRLSRLGNGLVILVIIYHVFHIANVDFSRSVKLGDLFTVGGVEQSFGREFRLHDLFFDVVWHVGFQLQMKRVRRNRVCSSEREPIPQKHRAIAKGDY